MNDNNTFLNLGLNNFILKSLEKIKYLNPSPIQKQCIPLLLKGLDVLGLAKTGSGKTAAFSLPLIQNLKTNFKFTQILILVPTRELAIQVSNSIKSFSQFIKNINIVAIYGGQDYKSQLNILRKGAHIVVGTPGRLLDHLKRGTLNLSKLNSLVLDEADEMLKMGFIEDVELILKKIPQNHQTALFSATMPEKIKMIINKFMNNPIEIKVDSKKNKLPDIQQSYCLIYGKKIDILIRFLEVLKFDAVLIFVRTKNATLEVSSSLEKYGYNSSPLNGDMNQNLREKTLENLKNNIIDILIATDIAARGLDVKRISLVINYDIPINAESYIHRIGRTGRAGKKGDALSFIYNNERRILKNIEHNISRKIKEIYSPKIEDILQCRFNKLIKKIENNNNNKDITKYKHTLSKIFKIANINIEELSISLLKIIQEKKSLIFDKDIFMKNFPCEKNKYYSLRNKEKNNHFNMKTYKIELGTKSGLNKKNIINIIINKFGIFNKKQIGKIKILNHYTTIELSKNISKKKINQVFHIGKSFKPV